jgi:hypothetical protein
MIRCFYHKAETVNFFLANLLHVEPYESSSGGAGAGVMLVWCWCGAGVVLVVVKEDGRE